MSHIQRTVFILAYCVIFMAKPTMAGWHIKQLTNNDYTDRNPVLTDTLVGWIGYPSSYWQVFVHDGNTNSQLTSSTISKSYLSGSTSYLAWAESGSPANVYVYDSTDTLQITSSDTNFRPRISGDYLVYSRSVNDVMLYNLASHPTTPTQILAPPGMGGTGNELDPFINGNWVSFTSNEGDSEIYYYDIAGVSVTKLTNNGLSDYESTINEKYIGYIHYDGSDREVMLYDRTADETDQLTNDSENSYNVFLVGDYCGYVTGESSNAATLNLYNTSDETTTTIASNVAYDADSRPSAHGDLIVYMGWDGNDWEIYAYRISTKTTTKITNNNFNDRYPRVRGNRIVWQHLDGPDTKTGDYEILLATYSEGSGLFFPIKTSNGITTVIQLPGK